MELRAALEAIQADQEHAGEILEVAYREGGRGFLDALGGYLGAVLRGIIIDPDKL